MNVIVSGPTFASLMHEHCISSNDQEGILLGSVESHITDTVSDAHQSNLKEVKHAHIHDFIPCDGTFKWYKSEGTILIEKLKNIIHGYSSKSIIGWYKFRRNSAMKVSLRENAVHRHLRDAFPGIQPGDFMFALFTTNSINNPANHVMEYTFHVLKNRKYEAIPLKILNLQDPSHSGYTTYDGSSAQPYSRIYQNIVDKYSDRVFNVPENTAEIDNVRKMNTTVYSQLSELTDELASTEDQIATLDKDLEELREKLHPSRNHAQFPKPMKQLNETLDREQSKLITTRQHLPAATLGPEQQLIDFDTSPPTSPKTSSASVMNVPSPVLGKSVQGCNEEVQLDGQSTIPLNSQTENSDENCLDIVSGDINGENTDQSDENSVIQIMEVEEQAEKDHFSFVLDAMSLAKTGDDDMKGSRAKTKPTRRAQMMAEAEKQKSKEKKTGTCKKKIDVLNASPSSPTF